ncbi:MAG TPA: helix-turn-helix domain-containing protein [Actinomycetota bacterium]|nr:helix-turn-helix domain-containing protein [Actinomycetota bacterium]
MSAKKLIDLECSIARALEVVGERWSLLILRDAFYGVRRFDDFQQDLGVARNILTDRLNKLVGHGVLEKTQYEERPPRYEYRLTEKGRDLLPVLLTMMSWGDRWAGEGVAPPVTLTHTTCGNKTHAVLTCESCGEELRLGKLRVHPIRINVPAEHQHRLQPVVS